MNETPSIETIAERLAYLEAAMAALSVELRTRRLVVVDDDERDRIVVQVDQAGVAELTMRLPGGAGEERSELLAFANPGEAEADISSGIGLQIWRNGNAVVEFSSWIDHH